MNEIVTRKYVKDKYVDISGQQFNGCEAIRYLYSIEKQYKRNKAVFDFWEWKCPQCGNLFVANRYSVMNGNTRSCGCLKRMLAKKMGEGNQKHNIIQRTPWDYIRVFFNNLPNVFFIIDKKKENCINEYNCTADKRTGGNSIDPCITVNGKKTRLYKFLMGTNSANDKECDHINRKTLDCRECNLRNGTHLQNMANTPRGIGRVISLKNGKYGIEFPEILGIDTSEYSFNTKEEAEVRRREIEYDTMGDWTYEESQKIAKKNDTFEFKEDKWVDRWANTGTLGKIMKLPPDNPLNARLRDLVVLAKGGKISSDEDRELYPDEEWRLQHELMYDYHTAIKQAER